MLWVFYGNISPLYSIKSKSELLWHRATHTSIKYSVNEIFGGASVFWTEFSSTDFVVSYCKRSYFISRLPFRPPLQYRHTYANIAFLSLFQRHFLKRYSYTPLLSKTQYRRFLKGFQRNYRHISVGIHDGMTFSEKSEKLLLLNF